MSVESIQLNSREDELSGDFCQCGCLTSEHEIYPVSKTTKCFGLKYDGASWSKCNCTSLVPVEFSITGVIEYADTENRAA